MNTVRKLREKFEGLHLIRRSGNPASKAKPQPSEIARTASKPDFDDEEEGPPSWQQAMAILQIEKWIGNCREHPDHELCQSLQKHNSPLPTRVIDVGDFTDSNHENILNVETIPIRLYETQNESEHYIALSHCWGDKTRSPKLELPLMTTSASYQAHLERIPWTSLSRTFRDAVFLTRALKIRYLWIDSLCIIQGEGGDWSSESYKMASVYGNAHLVLSADASENGSGGLFQQRPARFYAYCQSGGDVHDIPRVRNMDHNAMGDGSRLTNYFCCPLFQRRWCVQERLLAPRIVHFCRIEMIWECHTMCFCQCKEPGVHSSVDFGKFEQKETLKMILGGVGYKEHVANHDAWLKLLAVYTRADLTNPSDRLVALSGLAEKFQSPLLGRYLAGLWENFLIEGLGWRAIHGTTYDSALVEVRSASPSGADLGFPSWSFAAVPYWIDFPEYSITNEDEDASAKTSIPRATVVGIDCTPLGPLYGNLCQAELKISGRLLVATILPDEHTKLTRSGEYSRSLICSSSKFIMMPDIPLPPEECSVVCLLLQSRVGLVLTKIASCNGQERNRYRRLGIVLDSVSVNDEDAEGKTILDQCFVDTEPEVIVLV